MLNQDSNPEVSDILSLLEALAQKYEEKDKRGILFMLDDGQNPLDIIGVLDLMKYKFIEWKNINIFCYKGILFKDKILLVIGSDNPDEVLDIIIYMFLKGIVKEEIGIESITELIKDKDIEQFLMGEISENIVIGYPYDSGYQKDLEDHLKGLLND